MGTMVMIRGRASYLQQLWQEDQFDGAGDYYWSASCILDPSKPKQAACIAEIEAAEKAEFKAAYDKAKGNKPATFEQAWAQLNDSTRALRDGDLKGGEYEGCKYVSPRATKGKQAKPVVLNRQAQAVGPSEPGAPYAGSECVFQVEVWAQFEGKYKRTNITLMGVQFAADGTAFGGGKPADLSKFQALADTGEDEDDAAAEFA